MNRKLAATLIMAVASFSSPPVFAQLLGGLGGGAQVQAQGGPVNINAATAMQLQGLGFPLQAANAIVAQVQGGNPIDNVNELLAIPGVEPKLVDKLKDGGRLLFGPLGAVAGAIGGGGGGGGGLLGGVVGGVGNAVGGVVGGVAGGGGGGGGALGAVGDVAGNVVGGAAGLAGGIAGGGGGLNINAATLADLQALGLGPQLAQNIVAQVQGGNAIDNINELLALPGANPQLIDRLVNGGRLAFGPIRNVVGGVGDAIGGVVGGAAGGPLGGAVGDALKMSMKTVTKLTKPKFIKRLLDMGVAQKAANQIVDLLRRNPNAPIDLQQLLALPAVQGDPLQAQLLNNLAVNGQIDFAI